MGSLWGGIKPLVLVLTVGLAGIAQGAAAISAENAQISLAETYVCVDPGPQGPSESVPSVPHVFEGDVRTLPTLPSWEPGDPVHEVPRAIRRDGVHDATREAVEEPTTSPLLPCSNASGAAIENKSTR